jgi:hypothetical protein
MKPGYTLQSRLQLYDELNSIEFWNAERATADGPVDCVVIKPLDGQLDLEPFRNDIAVAVHLNHPVILRVQDHSMGQRPFMALEPFDGITLGALRQNLWLQGAERLMLAIEIVRSLADACVAFGAGVSPPREPFAVPQFKTGTVLLTWDGEVRLLPPLHRVYEAEQPSFARPPWEYELGVWEPGAPAGPRALVYMLGTMLFFLATGAPIPWLEFARAADRQRRPLADELHHPSRFHPELAPVDEVVRNSTSDTDRYATPRDLARALATAATSLPRADLGAIVRRARPPRRG